MVYGGGGGDRTRVRKSSAFGTTCLASLLSFMKNKVNEQTLINTIQLSFAVTLMARIKAILC